MGCLGLFSGLERPGLELCNKRFKEFISDIYPKELISSESTESTSVASYLDLLFT